MKMFVVFLLLGVCTETWSSCPVCTNIENFKDRIERNRVHNSTYETLVQYGLLRCVKQCLLRKRCLSINLELSSQTCHLNDHTGQQNGTTYKQGSIFTLKDSWPQVIAGQCSNHTCYYGSICVDHRSKITTLNYSCEPENRRNYGESVSKWSTKLPFAQYITVVKGFIITVCDSLNRLNAFSINKHTLKHTCSIVLQVKPVYCATVHKFGDTILVHNTRFKMIEVFNVDFKSITSDYSIELDEPYGTLVVANSSTLVGLKMGEYKTLYILTISGSRVTSCRPLRIHSSEVMMYSLLSVTHELNIIILNKRGRLWRLDQDGHMEGYPSYNFDMLIYDMHTDSQDNVFLTDGMEKQVFICVKEYGYFMIKPKLPSVQTPYRVVVDEDDTVYVLARDERDNSMYVHVYLFNY